jgi:hypothetical protein
MIFSAQLLNPCLFFFSIFTFHSWHQRQSPCEAEERAVGSSRKSANSPSKAHVARYGRMDRPGRWLLLRPKAPVILTSYYRTNFRPGLFHSKHWTTLQGLAELAITLWNSLRFQIGPKFQWAWTEHLPTCFYTCIILCTYNWRRAESHTKK